MAYQTTRAPLNASSAWNVMPHFSMTLRDALCPAAVTLMILASCVRAQPKQMACVKRNRAVAPELTRRAPPDCHVPSGSPGP